MIYLASYDIERNSLRLKLAKLLEKAGLERIQYSVFWGVLTESKKETLLIWVRKLLMNEKNTNFMLLMLEQHALNEAAHIGDNPPDWDYLKNEKLVLIL